MLLLFGYFVIVSGIFAHRCKDAKWRTFRIIAGIGFLAFFLFGFVGLTEENPYKAIGVFVMNALIFGIVYFVYSQVVSDRKVIDKEAEKVAAAATAVAAEVGK